MNQAEGMRPTADELRPVLQALLEDGDRTLVLGAYHEGLPGFQHGKMVGVLMMHVHSSLSDLGEVGWIEELYVRPDYRRKGLGEQLLDQALAWADSRGIRGVDLEIGEGHEQAAAEHLYAKHAFRSVARSRLHRSLPGAEGSAQAS